MDGREWEGWKMRQVEVMSRDSVLGTAFHSSDFQNMESHAREAKCILKVSQDALGELKMKYKQ